MNSSTSRGDAHRRPALVAPMQPRLDWQMWFAALGSPEQSPWRQSLCGRLLQGSPAERRATGAWWRRTRVGEFLPAVSFR